MELNERIELLLHFKNLSPSQFAEAIDVQRSSISHILSGRNKPSLDFISKVVKAFPDVSYNWLIDGSGTLNATATQQTMPLEEEQGNPTLVTNVNQQVRSETPPIYTSVNNKNTEGVTPDNSKTIRQIIVFYTDNSFETYFPGHPSE